MLEALKSIDATLLLFFNHLNSPFLDFIFFWLSDKWIWIPFYVYLAWLVFKSEGGYILVVFMFIAIAITISDQLASTVIKPYVMRLRPCHDPSISSQVHLVKDYCGGQYGFVSSHAANVFTLAVFLSGMFAGRNPRIQKLLWTWAIVVSFSRIYLGAHYPGDVLCGGLLGFVTGSLVVKAYILFKARYFKSLNKV